MSRCTGDGNAVLIQEHCLVRSPSLIRMRVLGALLAACASGFSCRASLSLDDYQFAEGESPGVGGTGGAMGNAADSESAGGTPAINEGTGDGGLGDAGTAGTGGAAGSVGANDLGGAAGVGSAGAGGTGSVVPLPDCTDCTPTLVASLTHGIALGIESPFLYYVDAVAPDGNFEAGYGPLMQISTSGGTPSPISVASADTRLTSILVDGAYVYCEQYFVSRVSILGSTEFLRIDGSPSYVTRLHTNSTHVFAMWQLTGQYVSRFPKEGGSEDRPITTSVNNWVDFDVDEALVFVASPTALASAPVAGGDPNVMAAADPGETLVRVAVADAQNILVASDQRLAIGAKAGGALATLSAGAVYLLTSDGNNAYFFRAKPGGGETCATGSDLYSVPLTGGAARHLATDEGGCVSDVQQDGTSVYWLPSDVRSILKASK